MSRLLLLLIFAIWLLPPGIGELHTASPAVGAAQFLGGYAFIVILVAFWARYLARGVESHRLYTSLNRFNRVLTLARTFIPVWLAYGAFAGPGWKRTVAMMVAPISITGADIRDAGLVLPGFILGTLPPILAWIGLWWAAYPADRALREQSLLAQLDDNLPVHAPPSLGKLIGANLRQQILFMFVPIILILLAHDVMVGVLHTINRRMREEDLLMLPAAALVYLIAPEILRRVLRTDRMPDSDLRRRLEGICERIGLRYRDILLWQTDCSIGNAAVMGLVPRWRYILLSDLLLETMTDQQIEAVFAHEVGHVVHHHMRWYLVFFIILALAATGPTYTLSTILPHWRKGIFETASALITLPMTFLVFGFLSRRFERQADVFAARMVESNWGQAGSAVGMYGASVFASALHRVAVINNIPEAARSWCHGSIQKRMNFLHQLSADPTHTQGFDRVMSRLYMALILAMVVLGAWTVAALWQDSRRVQAAIDPTSIRVASRSSG